MVISFVVGTCCSLGNRIDPERGRKITPYLDLIAGVALLIIGILGTYNIIGASLTTSWSLVGIGSIYTTIMLCLLLSRCAENIQTRNQCS